MLHMQLKLKNRFDVNCWPFSLFIALKRLEKILLYFTDKVKNNGRNDSVQDKT